jgi:hypothetical protein
MAERVKIDRERVTSRTPAKNPPQVNAPKADKGPGKIYEIRLKVESHLSQPELVKRMTTSLVDKNYSDFRFIVREVL